MKNQFDICIRKRERGLRTGSSHSYSVLDDIRKFEKDRVDLIETRK